MDEVNTSIYSCLLQVLEELEPWEAWCQVEDQLQCQQQYQVYQALVECQVSCVPHPEIGLYYLMEEVRGLTFYK